MYDAMDNVLMNTINPSATLCILHKLTHYWDYIPMLPTCECHTCSHSLRFKSNEVVYAEKDIAMNHNVILNFVHIKYKCHSMYCVHVPHCTL